MTESMLGLMRQATEFTRAGRLNEATQLILRSLNSNAASAASSGQPPPARRAVASQLISPPGIAASSLPARHTVLEGCITEIEAPAAAEVASTGSDAGESQTAHFTTHTFTHGKQVRRYKLFVPPGDRHARRPLVLMLHGCTQNPDDFAAGTAMNERAAALGFVVLYPEQSAQANPSRCWNWFKTPHQRRGSGEPALLASLTRVVMAEQRIDPRRVYVAGLSAGGAMAAILAASYPELYAAVGVHSGLAVGTTSHAGEAMTEMKGDATAMPGLGIASKPGLPPGNHRVATPIPVPAIVFHGDQDRTVHPRNAEKIVDSVLRSSRWQAPLRRETETGLSSNGHRFTRVTHRDAQAVAQVEHWVIHGAGHAWSGGRPSGSYTDARGPDASEAMLQFFLAHPHAGRGGEH